MFKVAYANKDKIQNSITQGVIPAESLIVTNNDNKEAELSYYDEENKMVTITERNYFEKGIEVEVFGHLQYSYSNHLSQHRKY